MCKDNLNASQEKTNVCMSLGQLAKSRRRASKPQKCSFTNKCLESCGYSNLLREDDVMERCTYNSLSWWEGKGEEGRG